MEKLRKHIKESFFNPVLHFTPILLFLVVDDFLGMNVAWKVAFPFALILLMYVYFAFNRIFTWHLIFTFIFVASALIAACEDFLPAQSINHAIVYEIVLIAFFAVFLIFRRKIHALVLRLMSNLIPMTNNFEELYKVISAFLIVLVFYVASFEIISYSGKDVKTLQQLLLYFYVGLLFFFSIYEILRIQLIRNKLIREEWWPIINNQGKIVGSIQQNTSLNDQRKYQHPVVRLLFIDKGMIFLVKKSEESLDAADLWDSTISKHVRMDETIEKSIENIVEERYNISNFKYMYLSNYTMECKSEIQYAFLFVSCLQTEFKLANQPDEQSKWWTQSQIEENFQTGIFSENFKIEYDLLQRSGLLETGKCECNCRLKEVIYNQSSVVRDAN
jgi:hypothetical protein